jgi:putative membrane protein insertion efficiency factor
MCTRPKHDLRRSPGREGATPSPLALLAIAIVQLYRHSLSAFLGRQCRYQPSCSEYALDALRRYGFWPGSFMALARICRCGPFGGHGFDPVPAQLRAKARWWLPWRYGVWRMRREEAKFESNEQSK